MSLRLSSSDSHHPRPRDDAPARTARAAGRSAAVARRLRPVDAVRDAADSRAGDAPPQEPLTAAVGSALVLLFATSGGFLLTDVAALGLISAASSWVLFALCCFQGSPAMGAAGSGRPTGNPPRSDAMGAQRAAGSGGGRRPTCRRAR